MIRRMLKRVSGFGEQVAVWINGKVDRVDAKFTEKIK
ncbi:DUF3954 domain-containing protein [Bacillus thuringiensis]|jgi:hypothetical protein|uniref:DUF3954 domain-containing protein n=3 Tax=Bacillus cereus group TaxID=86661 RepID=A0A9X6V3X1_BACTU|nr:MULTISPECIES: DUF3954 domain-containing protein [Bacillus]EOO08234.1 hypothetical protein IAW_02582 [Bacillus cereus str. Schrouff]EOO85866.1 hypothetical protein IGY_03197 [Bacillus cereus K-5975c]EOP89101.1 hypothetical protein IGM_02834 [Bacillus cereus HuB4-4]KAA0814458.1 DUF3954 domain-containing protein [Bacillus sp. AY2-1]KIP26387.1 hypothetical protein BG10_5870 [Bacillus thuringiensis serovar morrisoni]